MELFYQLPLNAIRSFHICIDSETTFQDLSNEIHEDQCFAAYLVICFDNYILDECICDSAAMAGDILIARVFISNLNHVTCGNDVHTAMKFPCLDKNNMVVPENRINGLHDLMKTYPDLVNPENFEQIKSEPVHQDIIDQIDFDIVYDYNTCSDIIESIFKTGKTSVFVGECTRYFLGKLCEFTAPMIALEYVINHEGNLVKCLDFAVQQNRVCLVKKVLDMYTPTKKWFINNIYRKSHVMKHIMDSVKTLPRKCAEVLMKENNAKDLEYFQMKGLNFTTEECCVAFCNNCRNIKDEMFFEVIVLPWSTRQKANIIYYYVHGSTSRHRLEALVEQGYKGKIWQCNYGHHTDLLYQLDSKRQTCAALSYAPTSIEFAKILHLSTTEELRDVTKTEEYTQFRVDQRRIIQIAIE